MVLVSSTSNPEACFEFVAEIYLSMHHTNTSIRKGFETTVQIENIRQTALIIEMDKVCHNLLFCFFALFDLNI
jgi:GTPase